MALSAVREGSVPIDGLYQTLSRILVDVGAAWQAGTTEVWQEHLVTGVVRNIVEACVLLVEEAAPRTREATAVLAAPVDEYHDLGLRMLTDRFILAGWDAHFLGGNVPLSQLRAAVGQLGADAVALSAATHFHRLSLRTYVAGLADTHPQLQVWVGGPAFAYEHEGWPDHQVLDPSQIPEPRKR